MSTPQKRRVNKLEKQMGTTEASNRPSEIWIVAKGQPEIKELIWQRKSNEKKH